MTADGRAARADLYVAGLTPAQVWRWGRGAVGQPGDPVRAAAAKLVGEISSHPGWMSDSEGWSGGGQLQPALRVTTQSVYRAAARTGHRSRTEVTQLVGVLLDFRHVLDQWREAISNAAAHQIHPSTRVTRGSGAIAALHAHRRQLLGELTELLNQARDLRDEIVAGLHS